MKVLWFSLSPCGSVRRFNSERHRQGWMISLENVVKHCHGIKLTVAYISSLSEDPFSFEGVDYFPLCEHTSSNSILARLKLRHNNLNKSNQAIIPQLLKAVEYAQPDLIHIHGTEERFGLIADYITNIPIAYSIQGLIAPITQKYWAGIPADIVSKYDTLKSRIYGISAKQNYKYFEERCERELHYLSNAKYILGRTYWDRRITLLCNPTRKYYQAEELLRESFFQNEWSKSEQNDVFRIVSTISGGPFKGVETILHAAALLKRFSKFNIEWNIIGIDHNNRLVHAAEDFKQLKFKSCGVKFLGRLNAEKVIENLMSSNLYCQVSHIENSPNSVCEAMLLGLPTIASFAGGTSSITKGDESEALLYQDGDPYALAGSIVDIYNNYDKAIAMGHKARLTSLYRHDPERIKESYYQIYLSILEDFKSNSLKQ